MASLKACISTENTLKCRLLNLKYSTSVVQYVHVKPKPVIMHKYEVTMIYMWFNLHFFIEKCKRSANSNVFSEQKPVEFPFGHL